MIISPILLSLSLHTPLLPWTGVIKAKAAEDSDQELKSVIVSQMRNPRLMNPDLVQCLMETCLDCFDSRSINNIDDNLVVRLCKKFNLHMLGILLLEKKPRENIVNNPLAKRRRTELVRKQFDDETVLAL